MAAPNRSPRSFRLGRLLITPGATDALARSGESPLAFLRRHAAGDWGVAGSADWTLNDAALAEGGRVLSAYFTARGDRLWIITEAEPRDATTILLPSDY